MNLPLHGSNPDYLYKALNIKMPSEIIDFSVNINPFGPPGSLVEKWEDWLPLIQDYPDPKGRELINLISKVEKVPNSYITLGNGGSELIMLLGRRFSGQPIGIIQPTFSEYEKATKAAHCSVSYIHLKEPDWSLDFEELYKVIPTLGALFICNPNNPTGHSHSMNDLLKLLEICEENKCFLIVDEAFYDFQMEYNNLSSCIQKSNYLILIRSLTKMFSIAGLRLGYLLANEKIINELKTLQPEWNVNAIALEAGRECISEHEFVQQTQVFIQDERERITTILTDNGYHLSNSCVNFYLLKDPKLTDQQPLLEHLLMKGIVPRHTESFPGLNGMWLRFSLRTRPENEMLLEALMDWNKKD